MNKEEQHLQDVNTNKVVEKLRQRDKDPYCIKDALGTGGIAAGITIALSFVGLATYCIGSNIEVAMLFASVMLEAVVFRDAASAVIMCNVVSTPAMAENFTMAVNDSIKMLPMVLIITGVVFMAAFASKFCLNNFVDEEGFSKELVASFMQKVLGCGDDYKGQQIN